MKASNALLVKESTELNALSKELKLVNEQLKRVDEMKDEFLYTVTHEIRTPLTSIRALSEILQDNPDISNEEKNTYLDAVVKETERLSHLITQVLNLERYESGRQSLKLSMVDMNEMIADIISSVDSLKREKSLTIHYAVPSLPMLELDRDLMHQVVYNLLTNAIKFAQSQITISATIQKQHILFSIQDDGIGIENEWQELVFDKFFQAQNQTLKKPEGSGLGLAISKRIMEMHGGKIWVESQFGQGATFCFEIPLKK
jgi:signal transduction histidine kinase